MPKLEWTEGALEDLESLDKEVKARVLKKVTWLSEHFDNIFKY